MTVLVVHDFDFSGRGILPTLGHDTDRYTFETAPRVIDLGLRLKNVQEMALDSEPYQIRQDKHRKAGLSLSACFFSQLILALREFLDGSLG